MHKCTYQYKYDMEVFLVNTRIEIYISRRTNKIIFTHNRQSIILWDESLWDENKHTT